MAMVEDDFRGASGNADCAHPGCNCAAESGKQYCSEVCRQAAATPNVVCECGHPECGGPLR